MGRAPCCDKANVKRGQWSPEEDATLKSYVETHGTGGNWIALPRKAGLRRCGKSCRLRWLNYLRPDIKHGGFTDEEDNIICTLYSQMGSRWSIIASQLPGRTDNDVKNYWNTKLKKKLLRGNTTILTQNPPISSLPCTPTSHTYNPSFSASHYAQSQSSPTLADNFNYGLLANTQSLSFGLLGVSEFGGAASSKNSDQNINVSQSQKGSSINSGSSFAAMDTKFVCLQQHDQQPNGGGLEEDVGILADFSFGYPSSDLVHGFWFQDKAGEVGPSCYPNSADFGYANVKPQGLNQTTVVNYQY